MYSKSDIINGIKQPGKVIEELKNLRTRIPERYHRRYTGRKYDTGINIMNENWDNLIVIDACRYDLFKKVNAIEGELKCVTSKASQTTEWFEQNFDGKVFPDTVFIAGNPNIDQISAEFTDIIRMWEENWNEDYGTALPETMVNKTLETSQKYPDKRLISMFVQPHAPFLGETGRSIDQAGFTGGGVIKDQREIESLWHRTARGDLETDTVFRAYEENLEILMPHLTKLTNELEGKTVITSDHGNAFGEKYIYGHPSGVHIDPLVQVPWLEINTNNRKTISETEELVSTGESNEEKIESRLSDLGYM